jgi:hypothetical protein
MHANDPNNIIVFMPNIQSQFMLEGMLVSSVILFSTISILILNGYVPYVKNGFLKRILSYYFMVGFYLSVFCLVLFFIFKNEWYLNDTPYSGYVEILKKVFSI